MHILSLSPSFFLILTGKVEQRVGFSNSNSEICLTCIAASNETELAFERERERKALISFPSNFYFCCSRKEREKKNPQPI